MPELPEVETVRRGLNQVTINQIIQGGDVLLSRSVAHPFSSADFLAGVTGTAIAQWHRRGKYLFAEIQRDAQPAGWLGVHLRMTGQLLWLAQSAPLQPHARARLFFPNQQELRFVDMRTFGRLWWVPPGNAPADIITGLQKLGPEPFSSEFSWQYLQQYLQHRKRPIKNALLDQAFVAGVGNIYADEALFLSGIRPTTLCNQLRPKQIKQLHQQLLHVLETSIQAGGTSFSNFLDVKGINGNYGGISLVYNREGQPCRTCNTPIQRLKLGGRSAHFCPTCQR